MITKQEMFDRAYRGLASQGWVKSKRDGTCAYVGESGLRCAWGWVDDTLVEANDGDVSDLRRGGTGIAAELAEHDLDFALALQTCHDVDHSEPSMEIRFERFAERWRLTIPVLS